ncbi:hypothetical protein CC80DRAFT_549806 [Byssothecium circinans]|uniref:Uncharacterized protein n=1 Tax=Byssothecium circinans TaxID=147558 RepID=A0A6A5TSX9_9PLEO|nr:hypothetical protein CC80DRAFT_549806 [Byssothecium circinans]
MRKSFPLPNDAKKGLKLSRWPKPSSILSNDIWKMGCIFTELEAFLLRGGSDCVEAFRDSITTVKLDITSDSFNEFLFDDGEKVKAEVTTFTNVSDYDDGVRTVRLLRYNEKVRLSLFDDWRCRLEEWTGRLIDWSPLPLPERFRSQSQTKAMWKAVGTELSAVLDQQDASRYMQNCLPLESNGAPLLPVAEPRNTGGSNASNRQDESQTTSRSSVPPGSASPTNTVGSSASRADPNPPLDPNTKPAKEVYLCADRVRAEPSETILSQILEVGPITNDATFYRRAKEVLARASGGRLRKLLSGKTYSIIDFFFMVWDNRDQVLASHIDKLPDPLTGYDCKVANPRDIHMRLAGIQMIAGLRHPEKSAATETTVLKMIPKKYTPPCLRRKLGSEGLGLHAKRGFSSIKIVLWVVVTQILGLDAFIPVTFMTSPVVVGLGIPQLLVE